MNKKINYLFVSVLMILQSCKPNAEADLKALKSFETSHEFASDAGIKKYATMCENFYSHFPQHPQSGHYLHIAAMYQYLAGDFNKAKTLGLLYQQKYPAGKEQFPNLTNLARAYIQGKFNNDSAVYFFEEASKLRQLSTADKTDLAILYEKTGDDILHANQEKAKQKFEKSADIFRQTGNYSGSVNVLKKIISIDTSFKTAPGHLQTIAFLYENEINQLDSAKTYYTELVKRFPASRQAKDAEYLLKNNLIGKSAEEILEFNLKNKKGQLSGDKISF